MMPLSLFIGWDPREAAAFAVARHSARRRATQPIPIYGLVLDDLIKRGLYTRPIEYRWQASGRIMWDPISEAAMSTQHANARFLVKALAPSPGWAMFTDGDVLYRDNVIRAYEGLDTKYALYCVKHDYRPTAATKMDGQIQTQYPRKNWSSVFILNTGHEANEALTPELINTRPGRDLHRFCWLKDEEIGELGPEWNYLVGHSSHPDPKIVHFTTGVPDMPGYENCEYADEWWAELKQWAS